MNLSPDGQYLVVSRACGGIGVFDLSRLLDPQQPVYVATIKKTQISDAYFATETSTLFFEDQSYDSAGSLQYTLWRCGLAGVAKCNILAAPDNAGKDLVYLPDGRHAISIVNGSIAPLDLDAGNLGERRNVVGNWRHAALNSRGTSVVYVVESAGDWSLAILSSGDLTVNQTIRLGTREPVKAAFTADGSHIAITTQDPGNGSMAVVQMYDLRAPSSVPISIDAHDIRPGTGSTPLWYTRNESDCVRLIPAGPAGEMLDNRSTCVRIDSSSDIKAVLSQAGLFITSGGFDIMVRLLDTGAPVFELHNVEPAPQSPLRSAPQQTNTVIAGYTLGAKLDENWPRVRSFGPAADRVNFEGGEASLMTAQRPHAGTKFRKNDSLAYAADDAHTAEELAAVLVATKQRIDPLWALLLEHSGVSAEAQRSLALAISSLAALREAEIRLKNPSAVNDAEDAIEILSPTLRRLHVRSSGAGSAQDTLSRTIDLYLAQIESWEWSTLGRAFILSGKRTEAETVLAEALRQDPANWQAHDAILWLSLDADDATFKERVAAAARVLDFQVLADTPAGLPSAFFDPEDLKVKRLAVQQLRAKGKTP